MSTETKKKQFFRVEAHSFNKNDCGKYIVRCGDVNCDKVLMNKDKLITTYNEQGYNRHYHIRCYKQSYNWRKYKWPNATKHIDNWSDLSLEEKIDFEYLLFGIDANKHQLFALDVCNPYAISDEDLFHILQGRDIELFTQTKDSYYMPPNTKWIKLHALIRLKQFYQQPECQHKLQTLVLGYMRFNVINNSKINIPVSLEMTILNYSQIF